MAAAGGLAEARTNTATDATLSVLRAFCRLQVIQFHVQLLGS
jgi:hypothetical protein